MKVLLRFTPDDDGPQTLYADMTEAEFERIREITEDPANADDVLVIESRVDRDATAYPWTFRVSRLKVEAES